MKKLLAILLAVCVVLGCTACSPSGEKVDAKRTQIYVSNISSGYGDAWIYEMKSEFEEAYKDVSFEEGKTGVQVMISKVTDTYSTLYPSLWSQQKAWVYFNENAQYDTMVKGGAVLDITDVVTGEFDINEALGRTDVPDYVSDEDKAIINRFYDSHITGLDVDATEGVQYYAIPHYEGFYGITLDADLIGDLGLFVDNEGVPCLTKDDLSDLETVGTGPDGVVGTYDDGLPATYDEFFALCDALLDKETVPMIFSGKYQFYITNVINALIADCNGYANDQLGYTFNGTSTKYISRNGDGDIIYGSDGEPELTTKAIAKANGYDIYNQAGYYYAFNFLQNLVKGKNGQYLYNTSFNNGVEHKPTQNTFLFSSYTSAQDVAMIAEGIWWVNEAETTFTAMGKKYPGSSAQDRDLRFIPLPKATAAQVGERTTLLESQNSYVTLRNGTPEDKIPLAKLFIQFCHQDEYIKAWTNLTGTPKALKYDMDDLSNLTPFARSVMEVKLSENTDISYQTSRCDLFNENPKKFTKYTMLDALGYTYPSTAFNEKDWTGEHYFNSLYSSKAAAWKSTFDNWL